MIRRISTLALFCALLFTARQIALRIIAFVHTAVIITGGELLLREVQDALVVIRMLQEILGGDPVADGACVPRQLQVFLQHLIGVAADPDIGGIAVISLALVGNPGMRPAMRLARTAAAAAPVVVVVIVVVWSHATVTSDC